MRILSGWMRSSLFLFCDAVRRNHRIKNHEIKYQAVFLRASGTLAAISGASRTASASIQPADYQCGTSEGSAKGREDRYGLLKM